MQSTPLSASNSYFNFNDTLIDTNSSIYETDSFTESTLFSSINLSDSQVLMHANYETESANGSNNPNLFNQEQMTNDTKKFQAACIIQKYYRRYKQVNFTQLNTILADYQLLII